GYDGKLHRFYAKQGRKLTEHVLVFQQIIDTPNMLSNSPSGRSATLVNGQYAPVIDMQPGDVQLWRMINANVSNIVPISFTRLLGGTAPAAAATPSPAPSSAPSSGFTYKQTAQDGVQLGWDNYNASTNTNPAVALDPANRVDLLVQAPATPGTYVVMDGPPHKKNIPIFYVRVAGNSVSLTQPFPATRGDYPRMPSFLRDLDSKNVLVRREIDYGWLGNLTQPGQIPDGFPQFTINGRQFQDRTIDEVMLLGSKEEWTVLNSTTGIPHPFHIHINPFQIFEVFAPAFDPTGKTPPNYLPFVVPQPFVWWDTFGIPPGVVLPKIDPSTGKPLVDPKTGAPPIDPRTGKPAVLGEILPGYFKMRSRFVDFTGLYVQHCHILTHEDRGMMQLLEVVSNKTILKHH
ncbi:MAG: hypothetical protein QOD51_1150, partial [Candidatus Eremiobacteraeota bacterium]|nr:hypothetical protein [Candidatus Eremiobacteraeota bacterium]